MCNKPSPQSLVLLAIVSAALAFWTAAVCADDVAVAELPIHRVSAIAIIAPVNSDQEPRILLIDLYPNKHDSCTDILIRGWHSWQDVAIHQEKDGWRFESGKLVCHASKILMLGEKADGNGLRWVGERRLRADDEVEAELP